MTMTLRQPTARRGRQLAAIAGVAAALSTPPVLLALLIGNPLPHSIPTSHTLTTWLRSPLSDIAALHVLAVAAWLTWLHLCACVSSELTRQLRGTTWRVPLGGVNERLAQHLVAAVLLAGPGLSVATTATPALAAAPAVSTGTPVTLNAVTSPAPPPTPKLTLVASTATVPAQQPATRPHADAPLYKEYVVAPPHGRYHDNLWDIAGRHLGDPMRWHEIFHLNDGRVMPDGQRLTRASLIQPGWVLRMPPDATGLPDAATPQAVTPTKPPRQESAQATTQPHRAATHAAQPVQPPAPTTASQSRVTAPAPRPRPEAEQHAPRAPRHNVPVPVDAGLAIAAIGVLAALERRRRVAQRHRKPGTRLRLPDPALAPVERRLRTQANDATAVAAAIRLAVALVADKDAAVTVRAAWHHQDGAIDLVLDTARPAVAPFSSSDRGWRLAPTDHGYTLAASTQADPAPTLTPVGTDGAGSVCYVNLEVPGLIALDGSSADTTALITGIVRSIAGAPWADELAQLVVPARLSRAVVGLDRVDILGDPPTLLDHLGEYSNRVAATLTGEPSLAAARRAGEADTVGVVILAGLTTTELGDQLRTAAMTPTAPIVAVLAEPHPDAQTWTCADGTLSIPGVAQRLSPLPCDIDEVETTAQLLEQALDTTPANAEDPRYAAVVENCPPERESRDVEVRVLGPIEVHGADRIQRKPVLELIVYLALHRRPVSSEQLSAALWPDREHNGHVLRSRMSEARAALAGGIEREGQTWKLAEFIGCDWQRFQSLAAGSRSEQMEALNLIRGRPFHGYKAEWLHLDGYLAEVEAAIVDLALSVAESALADDDPVTASAAAVAGLRASPYDERLYQLALSAAAARGATGEVRALREQHDRVLEEEIEPDDHTAPESEELYEQAIRPARRATG